MCAYKDGTLSLRTWYAFSCVSPSSVSVWGAGIWAELLSFPSSFSCSAIFCLKSSRKEPSLANLFSTGDGDSFSSSYSSSSSSLEDSIFFSFLLLLFSAILIFRMRGCSHAHLNFRGCPNSKWPPNSILISTGEKGNQLEDGM